MPSGRLPLCAFALLLIVAACIVAGGATLARRTETRLLPRDREPLHRFASTVEEQTRRLDRLYELHLRTIAQRLNVSRLAASRERCERIVGVRRVSLLHATGERETDQHLLTMRPPPGQMWPEPTFRARHDGLPRQRVRLPENTISADANELTGWIDLPGDAHYYWQRRDLEKVVIVLTIDRAEVVAAVDHWLRAWLASDSDRVLAALEAAGGADRFLGAGQSLLASTSVSAPSDRPHFLLPLRGRFGAWQVASWDQFETRTHYDAATLVTAAALGLFTALLGCAFFILQRRATALAAQRVSFVNRVSHELRTPLTNILLNVDLANETLADRAPEAARRLTLVQEESQRLGRLIDNVLTFSRHEQGKLRSEPRACVPAAVIDVVVAQFAPSFQRRALRVECSGELRAPCLLDADAFAQILGNLLSNVEKYVPGGIVRVAGTRVECTLIVSVSDDGPGIPAEAAERVFRPFERLDSRVNEGASGTGLGLAIARDLAASMGGSLRLLPSARGAAFELRVPAPEAPAIEAVA